MERKYKLLDTDESGILELSELLHVLMEECAVDEPTAREMVDDFDKNKDGEISKDEFVEMWSVLFSY